MVPSVATIAEARLRCSRCTFRGNLVPILFSVFNAMAHQDTQEIAMPVAACR